MASEYAVRNIRLCTKDCLCLYVCPTGAADTENSIIDPATCIGCGACAKGCPSGAISMVPRALPPQQPKTEAVRASLYALLHSRSHQESLAAALPGPLAAALARSGRIMAEDLLREAGYMLPQSANAHQFLQGLAARETAEGFPKEAVDQLLELLPPNEPLGKAPQRWKCSVCGYIHEGPLPEGFTCPRCKQPASAFTALE